MSSVCGRVFFPPSILKTGSREQPSSEWCVCPVRCSKYSCWCLNEGENCHSCIVQTTTDVISLQLIHPCSGRARWKMWHSKLALPGCQLHGGLEWVLLTRQRATGGHVLTPGHLEAVGLDSSSDDRSAGTAGPVRVGYELHHLAGVTLPLWVICRHLEKMHECGRWEVILQLASQQGHKGHYVSW